MVLNSYKYSLRGRRSKGKGKGIRARGEGNWRETTRPSRFSRALNSLSQNSLSLPFQTPATQANKYGYQVQ